MNQLEPNLEYKRSSARPSHLEGEAAKTGLQARVNSTLKRQREEQNSEKAGTSDRNPGPLKKAKVEVLETIGLQDMPSEIMTLITSYLPYKAEVVSFEEAAKAHRDYTGDFWKRQIQIEGLGLFPVDPSKTSKEQYLQAKAVIRITIKLNSEAPLSYKKSCEIYQDCELIKKSFPELSALFRYVLYQREQDLSDNPFNETTAAYRRTVDSGYRKGIPGYLILQGLLNPAKFWNCMYEATNRKPIASLLAVQVPDCPTKLLYDYAVSAADRGDFRAIDFLLDSPPHARAVYAQLKQENRQYPAYIMEGTSIHESYSESINDYAKVLELYGPLAPYKILQRIASAKQILALAEDSSESKKLHKEAESLLTQALGNYRPPTSDLVSLLSDLAWIKLALKKCDEAEALYSRVNLLSENRKHIGLMTKVKLKLKKFDEAEALYNEELAASNKNCFTHTYLSARLARVKMILKKFDEADDLFKLMIQRFEEKPSDYPPKMKALNYLRAAQVKSELGDSDAERKLFDKGIRLLVEAAQEEIKSQEWTQAKKLLAQAQKAFQTKGIETPNYVEVLVDQIEKKEAGECEFLERLLKAPLLEDGTV